MVLDIAIWAIEQSVIFHIMDYAAQLANRADHAITAASVVAGR